MANATDSGAHRVHGTDPQYLIEKIIRQRIYDSPYWKEKCFGLDAATLVDQAVLLTHCGGIYSDHNIPTAFLCLTLKLLQLSPATPIVVELLQQPTYKYLRLLAALHIRLTGRAEAVYGLLDGLLSDWRKVRRRREDGGWELLHVDELIDEMLTKERCCSVTLPRLAKREQLLAAGRMEERRSALQDMMDVDEEEDEKSKEKEAGRKQKEAVTGTADERKEPEVSGAKQVGVVDTTAAVTASSGPSSTVSEPVAAKPSSKEDERHRDRDRDRDRDRYRNREGDGDRRDERSREQRRDERDDAADSHRRHSSSRHHHRRNRSSSRSRSPDRHRHSRRQERDENRDRERRHRDDRHHRRRRSASSSRSRSYSPRRHSRKRSRS